MHVMVQIRADNAKEVLYMGNNDWHLTRASLQIGIMSDTISTCHTRNATDFNVQGDPLQEGQSDRENASVEFPTKQIVIKEAHAEWRV